MVSSGTPVGNMIIKVDLDSVGVEKSMTGLQRQLKSSNKAMGAQLSAFDRGDKSAQKYGVMIDGLSNRHKIQAQMVKEAKDNYDQMSTTYGENSVKAQQAAQSLNEQIARYQETGRQLDSMKSEFKEFQRVQEIQSKGWYKVADGMDNWGGKLKVAGANMSDVGSKMTKAITVPAVGVTAAVSGIVAAFGWKRLTGLDTAQAQLRGLGYSTKDVGRISEDVTKAIDGGMTTMAEGTAVAAGAMAAGVKEGKDLQRYIKLVGDAAVGANRPVEEMAQIFNRVEGSGKLMTQELNSIEMGMPGFSKAMSKHLGVSTEKLREMVTDGKVSAKDFKDVMEDFAGGMAEEYSKSWDGMVANTKAYIGIIGESFLQGVFEDSKKSLADFIEVLKSPEIQQRAAEMGEVAREAFSKMKDSIVGVVEWYQDLDDGQKTMIKRLGLVAVAGGPVLQVVGKLTTGIGGLAQGVGKMAKAVGLSNGAGALGAISGLGKAGVVGLAIAGVAALSVGVYKLVQDSKEAEEVNLDLAKSFSDQAGELEKNATTFDKLSDKAKISNEQLAELNDLNIRISESSNPGEIKELQEQYNELAKKSGLSKDELKELFDANGNIIKQSPDVKTSVSEQGNAFAENTEAVKKQIQALRDLSEAQLKGERAKLLEQEQKARETIAEKTKEQAKVEERMLFLAENQNLSKDELNQKIKEAEENLKGVNRNSKEGYELDQIHTDLVNIKKERVGETVDELEKQNSELQSSIDSEQKKIDKLDATEQQMLNIRLANAGINEEGEKGLAQLDKSLVKNSEEIEKLEQKKQKNGELSEKEQERLGKLKETVSEQEKAKQNIFEELGIYNDLNSLADSRIEKLGKEGQKKVENLAKTIDIKAEEGNIIKQIDKKNSKHVEEIGNLEEKRKKNGANKKEIDGQIASIDSKIIKNAEVKKQILQETGIWKDLDGKIKDGINSEIEKGHKVNETKGKLDSQGKSIDNNNSKTSKGINLEEARTIEAGKNVTKNVAVKDNGTIDTLNLRATAPKNKSVAIKDNGTINTLNLGATAPKTKSVTLSAGSSLTTLNREASSPVRKVVNLVGVGGSNLTKNLMSRVRGYAKGTPPQGHSGGPAVVGDGGGRELISTPNGATFLSPNTDTMIDLPKGSHVIPHRETERLFKSVPRYASGTNDYKNLFSYENLKNNELMKLLALTSKDSETKIRMPSRSSGSSNNNGRSEELSLLKQQVQLLTELVLSSRNIEEKPVISEGDIKRSYDKMDAKRSSNHGIFTGRPGGAY